MTDYPTDRYDNLDAQTLTNLLTDAQRTPEVHQRALNALTRIQPEERRSRLILVLRQMMREPASYGDEVKLSLVEALATDPHPAATTAMLQVLPDILAEGATERRALPDDFREYFYEALVTRSRSGDLDVWRRILPQLDAQTLVAMLLDPVGQALVAGIEPLELILRLDEPERSRALISAVVGMAYIEDRQALIREASEALLDTAGEKQNEHALEILEERWSRARRSGRDRAVANLELALSIIDQRPRSRTERFTGRRPWAA